MFMVVSRALNRPAHTLNTYLRKLESWDQYGGMCVLMCVLSGKKEGPLFYHLTHTSTHTYLHTDPSFQVYVSKC